MLNLIGEFKVDKIDFVLLKSSSMGMVSVFTKAWETTFEWDDKVFPNIVANAVDRLQKLLTTVKPDGGPIRFGAIPQMEANGPPIFGIFPAEHTRFAVEDAILKSGGTQEAIKGIPDIIIQILQLIPDLKPLMDIIKMILDLMKTPVPA